MEKYDEIKKLGKGAQASCYLVRHKVEGVDYVLKKIECDDENAARMAFKEAMALSELKHKSVCGYKEFFVTWDAKNSAMYVCIIMENYPKGDLSRVIKARRQKNQKLEFLMLKKWTAQMLDSLQYIHNKNIIHRDLKPSNIFLRSDLTLSIGDFGVATLMDDKRTKTRTTVGSVNWMAPEVFERPYDDRSDVWSFGCIVLELASCSVLDESEIKDVLFDMKQDSGELETVLAKVATVYSEELANFIRKCLTRNFHQRPTTKDLCKMSFAQEALTLIGSALGAEITQTTLLKTIPAPGSNWDVKELMEYLELYHKHTKGVSAVLPLVKAKGTAATLAPYRKPLLMALAAQKQEGEIVVLCLNCIATAGVTTDLARPLVSALRAQNTNRSVQMVAMPILAGMNSDKASTILGELGAIQEIVSTIRKFEKDETVLIAAVRALWTLCVNEPNATIATAEKALKDVLKILSDNASNAAISEECISLIWALSLEDDNEDLIIDSAIPMIIEALQKHKKELKVCRAGLMALTAIASCGENTCYRILSPLESKEVNGIEVVIEAIRQHIDNRDICEEFVLMLDEMTEDHEIKAEMKKMKSLKLDLNKVKSKHKKLEKIGEVELKLN